MRYYFEVEVYDGEVYINGEFVAQLCFDGDSVGVAIADYIDNMQEE